MNEPFSMEDIILRILTTAENRSSPFTPYEYVLVGPPNHHQLWGWYGEKHGWEIIVTSWQWRPVIVHLLSDLTEAKKERDFYRAALERFREQNKSRAITGAALDDVLEQGLKVREGK